MRGIASGSSVSEIAAQMHLSVKTVSTYRTRLLDKMGMTQQRRAHAVRARARCSCRTDADATKRRVTDTRIQIIADGHGAVSRAPL